MLVETKARVGVFAIALGAYLPQFPTLVPEFEGQYAAFKKDPAGHRGNHRWRHRHHQASSPWPRAISSAPRMLTLSFCSC